MNFEHLVQINDPLNPLDVLTPDQLWEGLVLRAEQPQLFVIGLDSCTISERSESALQRELHFGATSIRDRVTFVPRHQVRYEIAPTTDHVGGSLTMTIEQPDELQLFLRFHYATTLPDEAGEEAHRTREIVKSAYREADIDTVRLIRQYVHAGTVSGPLH